MTVYQRGLIPHMRIQSNVRFSKHQVLEWLREMSYSLPKYYSQDIHPDVMGEIMREMQEALPEPSLEDLDRWLDQNLASTESWLKRTKFFIS